jgi:hypothetical protein
MKIQRFSLSILLLAGFQLGAISQQSQQQSPRVSIAERHYLTAKRLIRNNCIDCMGSTKHGMEQGIQEMEAALAAGFTDQKAAYKLLSDAYNAMTTFSEHDEKEQQAFAQKENEAVAEVHRLDPQDPEFAVRYADTLKDKQEKLAIYKAVTEKYPLRTDAAFLAGMLLIGDSKTSEGIPYIATALANEKDPEAVLSYAKGVMGAFQDQNCPFPSAERWNQKFNHAFIEATRGEGDPREMLEVKKQFLEELVKQRCKTNP